MLDVSGQTKHGRVDGKNRVSHSRDQAGCRVEQAPAKKKDQRDRGKIDQEQAEVNTSDCLSENRHDHGISGIRSGKLHVVSQLVWGNSLQHQLTGISIFALSPFSGNPKKRMRNTITKARKN